MKSLVASAALGIASVASVLILIVVHECLAAMANGPDKFVAIRRWLTVIITVLVGVLAILIVARFYYLRT
jgi:hypothetical protein